jgi:beta-mannosidase
MPSLDLNGGWLLHGYDGQRGSLGHALAEQPDLSRFIPAQVPGCAHLDLMAAGIIADPAEGLNALACRWVEESQWLYRKEFMAPAGAISGRAWLRFECLDLAAKVFLNGERVAEHANAFMPLSVEVSGRLKPGRNILVVQLESGLWMAGDKPAQGLGFTPDAALTKRHWLRKPQFQFNWDWATRLLNVGIEGAVRLDYGAEPLRLQGFSCLASLDASLKQGKVLARVSLQGPAQGRAQGRLRLSAPGLGLMKEAPIEVGPGLHEVRLELDVPAPELWWPVGLGQPARHELRLALLQEGHAEQAASCQVGFRRIQVEQGPHPGKGSWFYLKVNNLPVFCKGANWVPCDLLLPRAQDPGRLAALVGRALELNFNFLRVWGGGMYESEAFYELCDSQGLMVWQEFAYACSRYPHHDQAFREAALAEARHQVRRLACRPSLVAWCGNNENEQGVWDWGFEKGADHAFFHQALAKLMEEEDPSRHFQPSSPLSPGEQHPNSQHCGDQHPWAVSFEHHDWRAYRQMECRFANEGGLLGPVSLPTLRRCFPQGQGCIGDFAWQQHDNSLASRLGPLSEDAVLKDWLGLDIRKLSLEEWAYWGGLLQGEALSEYCLAFRRRRMDSGAAIFWMFNDSWPATRSWSVVDHGLKRTPSFHPVRRAMAPLALALALEGDKVVAYGVNDTLEDCCASLRFGVFNLAGGYALDARREACLKANDRTALAEFPASAWPSPQSQLAFAMLEGPQGLLARARLCLPKWGELHWPKPAVSVRLEAGQAVFESPSFAWGICLDLDGEQALADNFFDLYPGQAYRIPWLGQQPPRILACGNRA